VKSYPRGLLRGGGGFWVVVCGVYIVVCTAEAQKEKRRWWGLPMEVTLEGEFRGGDCSGEGVFICDGSSRGTK